MTSINFQNSLKRLPPDLSLVQIQACNVTLILNQNNTEMKEQIFTVGLLLIRSMKIFLFFFC